MVCGNGNLLPGQNFSLHFETNDRVQRKPYGLFAFMNSSFAFILTFAAALAASRCAAGQTNADRVITIPWGRSGLTMKEAIIKSEPEPSLLASEQDRVALIVSGLHTNLPGGSRDEVTLPVGGKRIRVPVTLAGIYHEVQIRSVTNQWNVAGYFELHIVSKTPGLFEWSSWHRDSPHRFQTFIAESGASYACAIANGVQLWRLTENRPSELMRERLVNMQPHPDALPLLPAALVEQAVGRTNLIYGSSGSLRWWASSAAVWARGSWARPIISSGGQNRRSL
jgi:hypothetical protein